MRTPTEERHELLLIDLDVATSECKRMQLIADSEAQAVAPFSVETTKLTFIIDAKDATIRGLETTLKDMTAQRDEARKACNEEISRCNALRAEVARLHNQAVIDKQDRLLAESEVARSAKGETL